METPDGWTKCLMHYDAKNKIVYIGAKKAAFVPEYLDYLLEYHGIPKNVKRIFKEDKK